MDLQTLKGSFQIILIDLALAGDTAVVIGMAAATLPPVQRRTAILLGAGMAVGMRIVATLFVTKLLGIPWLSTIGGLLVSWIAVKLVVEDEEAAGPDHQIQGFWHAVRVIAFADLVMSVDNVLAVGGASHNDWRLVVFGLILSIPLVMFCSQWIAQLLARYPRLAEVGAFVLGYTGGEMILHDLIRRHGGTHGLVSEELLGWAVHPVEWGLRLGMGLAVLAIARIWVSQREKRAHRRNAGAA